MLEKANSLPLSSLCIKEAPAIDRLPTPMWDGMNEWFEHHDRIRRLRAHVLNVGLETR